MRRDVFHHAARALPGLLLVHDVVEARALWRRLVRLPVEALVIMPNHVHLIAASDLRGALSQVLAGHARALNARRGTSGRWVAPLPAAEPLADVQKLRRAVRYVHLNPCRARLVSDPLQWPWSTHRDRVGLALDPVVSAHPNPKAFHAYVSADPSVATEGTPLPSARPGTPTPAHVRDAVSALARCSVADLSRRGRPRTTYLAVAAALCDAPRAEIAGLVDVERQRVRRGSRALENLVLRVLADPRFPPLGWPSDRTWGPER